MDYNDVCLSMYYDAEERRGFKHERINEELMRRRERALRKISSSVSPTLVESVASLISSKACEGNTYAENIIMLCDLDEEEILALREDTRGIYEALMHGDEDDYKYG